MIIFSEFNNEAGENQQAFTIKRTSSKGLLTSCRTFRLSAKEFGSFSFQEPISKARNLFSFLILLQENRIYY